MSIDVVVVLLLSYRLTCDATILRDKTELNQAEYIDDKLAVFAKTWKQSCYTYFLFVCSSRDDARAHHAAHFRWLDIQHDKPMIFVIIRHHPIKRFNFKYKMANLLYGKLVQQTFPALFLKDSPYKMSSDLIFCSLSGIYDLPI